MKRWRLSVILLPLSLFISCLKSKEATTLFEVFEFKTNVPIPSVQIDLLRCSDYDNLFGCRTIAVFATGYTDNNGKYSFKQSELNRSTQGIELSKQNYWRKGGNPGKNYLSTEGWINLHLIRQNNYSLPRLFFDYEILGESYSESGILLQIPVDTTIKIRAFGNQVNKINWVIGNLNILNQTMVAPLANGILTQNIDRLGTSSITLSY